MNDTGKTILQLFPQLTGLFVGQQGPQGPPAPGPSVRVPLHDLADQVRDAEVAMRGRPRLTPLKVSVLTDVVARGFRGPTIPRY